MMIYKQAIALLFLLLTLIVAACDKPEAKPSTNVEKDEKADTDTDSEGESSGGSAGETGGESGGESVTPAHSFAFDTASHKVAFTSGGTYTKAVVETNKPAGDARDITYTSSENAIATVNGAGVVTFVTQGTVTITATKAAISGLLKATASYILTIDPPNFAFGEATVGSHKVAFTEGTYTRAVDNTNKPAGDARDIEYTSSETKIATVDDAGVVTFIKTGTVTITATKTAEGDHVKATASYELTITKMKPANKQALVDEITRAMDAHGNEVDLNYIDVSDITDMSHLFSSDATNGYGRQAFNGDISEWDVSAVTDMRFMFFNAASFNQDISDWNVAKVTNMGYMFYGATSFNQDISRWNVARVTHMNGMFGGAKSFNQNISGWNVARVTNMGAMFWGATSFNQNISGWKVEQVSNMVQMFQNATSFTHNIDAWGPRIHATVKDNSWTNANFMFKGSGLANKLPSWCASVEACRTKQ